MARKFATGIDLLQNQLLNAALQNLASDPGSPVAGQIWFNTTRVRPVWYDGVSANNDIYPFATGNTANTGVLRDSSGNFTAGTITAALSGNATTATTATTLNPTANVPMNSFRLTGLADPTSAQDAATKNYVDSVVSGLDVKAAVVIATTTTLPAYTQSGTGGGTLTANANGVLTIDGVSPTINQRILVKNETGGNQPYNGIYTLTQVGTGSVPYILTRAVDANTSSPNLPGTVQSGMFTFVESGTANTGAGYVLTTTGAITLNTTALTFTQFSGAGELIAGNGITLTGNTISLNVTARFSLGTSLDLASGIVSTGTYSSVTVDTYGRVTAGADIITSNGLVVRTGAGTFAAGTITGTTNRITVTGGTGTTPTIDIAATYVGQTSITTLGTVATGTWQATILGVTYGGTGISSAGVTAGQLLIGTSGAFSLATLTQGTNISITSASGSITINTSATVLTGTGAANQIAVFTGTQAVTSSAAFTSTTVSGATLLTVAAGTSTATSVSGQALTSSITYTGAATATMAGTTATATGTPGSAATGTYVGAVATGAISSAANSNAAGATVQGVQANATFATSFAGGATTVLANLAAVQALPSVGSTNATTTNIITNVYGVQVTPGTWTSSGGGGLTVTNYYGIYLGAVTLSTTTITNRYGLYQADASAVNQFLGKANFAAVTSSFAPINVGQATGGTVPSSPVNGDMWITAAGLFAQIAGTTVGPFATGTGSIGGTGAANQVAIFSGTSTIGSAGTFTATTTSGALLVAVASGTSTATSVATSAFTTSVTYSGAITVLDAGITSTVTATPGSAASGTWAGVVGSVSLTSAANVFAASGTILGAQFNATFATANTSGATVLATLAGIQVTPSVGSSNATTTNTITNVYGVEVTPGTWTSSGGGGLTVTNYYGLFLGTVTLSTTTITNRYGIFQQDAGATNSFAGEVFTPATTTGHAGLNLGQGTAPTSPANGDIWIVSTGLYAQAGGTTMGPFAGGTGASTQIAFWSATNTLTGNAGFTMATVSGALALTVTSGTSTATTSDASTSNTITYTGAVTGVMTGDSNVTTATPGSAATGTWSGSVTSVVVSSAANVFAAGATATGGIFNATFNTANTSGATVLAALAGIQIVPSVVSTNASGTNTIAAVYGINVAPGTFSSTGGGGLTITNYYGLFLGTVTLTTTTIATRYGIFQQDPNATNSFAGSITGVAATFTGLLTLTTATSNIVVTQGAASSGTPVLATFTGAAHTGLTANTEVNDFFFNLARTVTFANGTIATQRAIRIAAPTYAFTSAGTITAAATFAISGAPVQGSGATLTATYALWVQGGISRFDGNISINDAVNVVLGTTTGTQWGTSTSQKQGFYGATPVVQQTGDVRAALSALGLVTSGTYAATNLTGQVGVANGGTGASATPTNGQVLIGNGSTFSVASITAGTGISITPGAGTLTIATTGLGTVNKFAQSFGNGALTTFTITHSLGTQDVIVQVYDNSTLAQIEVDVVHTSTSVVTLTTSFVPTSNQLRAVVTG